MKRPPHPTLEFAHLLSAPAPRRLASLAGVDELEFFFNARSALYHVFRALRREERDRVLLPAFHCVSVVEPALQAGLQVEFFRVDHRLGIDSDDLCARLGDDVAAVLFINYFGYPARFESLLAPLRARGIAVIEDCSHSFLLGEPLALSGGRADLSVYSLWKLVPSGVGGALRGSLALPRPALRAPRWKDSAVRAKRLFEEAIVARGEASWLARVYSRLEAARVERRRASSGVQVRELAPAADPALEFDPRDASTRLPGLPRHILRAADLAAICASRRANFDAYQRAFAAMPPGFAALPELPARICPWAYPVFVADRSRHDQRLRAQGVPVWTFGDVLHPLLEKAASAAAVADARFLAQHLLCLPVHQGIAAADVREFAATIIAELGVEAIHAH